ncbi:MAG TPA: CrcB family protein [Steroidobacteraceae bacterium]|nr:CrcB family protein [Steroidobacteraceae bacterium]
MNWLWVAIGGALGSVARYGVWRLWPSVPGGFPVPTITVNLLGSFAIGLIYIWIVARADGGDALRLFLMTGVLGGFTTYSAFALESTLLGFSPTGIAYLLITIVGCFAAAWAGRLVATALFVNG